MKLSVFCARVSAACASPSRVCSLVDGDCPRLVDENETGRLANAGRGESEGGGEDE